MGIMIMMKILCLSVQISQQKENQLYMQEFQHKSKKKKDLQNQIKVLTDYANSNGYKIEKIYSDIASGLSYDRGQFIELLNNVLQFKIKTIFITNKDRFTRVSFNMWKQLFSQFNCEIKVLNDCGNTNDNTDQEIFADIISLLHCFAMKMYSQ